MPLQLQKNRFLSEFSTFGIGGPIRYFVEVSSIEEMEEAYLLDFPKLILGKGSNCLFPDEGFDGLAILNKIDFCHWNENEVTVGSGHSFSLLGVQTARKGLSGLEFASGIPATVGGAVWMNAGANGRETCDSLKSVLFFDGARREYLRSELSFSYRTSPFQQMKGTILSATFALQSFPEARKSQLQIVEYRMKTQPLKEKSAGCIFRNPPGHSAGALIDKCGLKGVAVGGAKVSEIHANFIVNHASASASDVKELIRLVQEKVFEQTGVHLEPEVRMIHAK
jgi:UDP-N-acetylmuramate dehydrogenase